jgi:FkbM family methyltransferase
MVISRPLKQLVRRLLIKRGYDIIRIDQSAPRSSMEGAIRAIANRKHAFRSVIDIGASDGRWSASLMQFFPNCQYLLIEAQPVHEQVLKSFCATHVNTQYVLAAAGSFSGQVFFNASDPFSGQASFEPYPDDNLVVPMTTVDDEAAARSLPGPFLLKFDTHGFEASIIQGAAKTLAQTDVMVMECYNFKLNRQTLLFYEMCQHLMGLGFRCIDLVDPMHRSYDGAFWQMDLVFVKADRPEFAYHEYA